MIRREQQPLDDAGLEEDEDFDEEESVFEDEDDREGPLLYGPDERDRDLLDGTWERKHYGGKARSFNWEAIYPWLAAILILSMVIPVVLVAT